MQLPAPRLTTAVVDFSLEVVTGGVSLQENSALETIVLPSLRSVGGPLYIDNNFRLAVVSATNLAFVGDDVDIGSNGALATLSLPALTETGGSLTISHNAKLVNLLADRVSKVSGFISINSNLFSDYDGLAALSCVGNGRTDRLGDVSDALKGRVSQAFAAFGSPACQ